MENKREYEYTKYDYLTKAFTLVEPDDKYKLVFMKREIFEQEDNECGYGHLIKTDYLDEEILKEPINLKGLRTIIYEFMNYYRTVEITIKIDKNNDNHIWKPGDDFVPIIPAKNDKRLAQYNGPHCSTRQRFYPSKYKPPEPHEPGIVLDMGSYKTDDYEHNKSGYDGWYIACTGYCFQPKMDLALVAQSGMTEGHYYNSLQTAREARKIFEQFFPKWSLR